MEKYDVFIEPEQQSSLMNTGLSVDENVLQLCPSQLLQDSILYPVKVSAGGNCLPHSGSVLAFGDENKAIEMRVKIVVEVVLHMDRYLSQA